MFSATRLIKNMGQDPDQASVNLDTGYETLFFFIPVWVPHTVTHTVYSA
jgi:hypothetical protein